MLLLLTLFLLPAKFNLNHHTTWAHRQFCISPHNSKALDNKVIAGLKFRPCTLPLRSDLNTAAVRWAETLYAGEKSFEWVCEMKGVSTCTWPHCVSLFPRSSLCCSQPLHPLYPIPCLLSTLTVPPLKLWKQNVLLKLRFKGCWGGRRGKMKEHTGSWGCCQHILDKFLTSTLRWSLKMRLKTRHCLVK